MKTLDNLSDYPTPEEIMQLDRASLDLIPFERRYWVCKCKGCGNVTAIRDYGINPWYLLDKNSKQSFQNPVRYWRDLNNYFYMCSKHWKLYDRLLLNFDKATIQRKILDYNKEPVQPFRPPKNKPFLK